MDTNKRNKSAPKEIYAFGFLPVSEFETSTLVHHQYSS
jgi:hypothetical protein